MKFEFTPRAEEHYRDLPPKLQALVKKQISLLCENLRHPSLHAKKYDESENVWQGRVNRDYRFFFITRGDTHFIISIRKHPK